MVMMMLEGVGCVDDVIGCGAWGNVVGDRWRLEEMDRV